MKTVLNFFVERHNGRFNFYCLIGRSAFKFSQMVKIGLKQKTISHLFERFDERLDDAFEEMFVYVLKICSNDLANDWRIWATIRRTIGRAIVF